MTGTSEVGTEADVLAFDLVILGGGMAGMTAASYACTRGASVCVIEKGVDLGGSAVLSAGIMWAASSLELLREHAPRGNAQIQRAFIERFPIAAEWVRSTGVSMSSKRPIYGFGEGYALDILGYIRRCEAVLRSGGGWVLRSTTVDRLIVEEGRVTGVIARTSDGSRTRVRARAVILATGGFQGNRSLLYEQFGENVRQLLLRSNVHSTGDGLRLGLEVGADIAGDMSTFYGHLIAWPLLEFGPKDFRRLTLAQWSLMGLLIDLSGQRFTDESFGYQANAIETAKRPHARAALLLDAGGYERALRLEAEIAAIQTSIRSATNAPAVRDLGRPLDNGKLNDIRSAGARVASDETLEGLMRTVGTWGFDPAGASESVAAYNLMVRGGEAPGTPTRRWNRYPFGPAPYLAFEVRPAITGTQGGLRVDERSRVLDRSGRPIPGLLAAGTDAGDLYNGGYAGNLSVCCVFGMTAVESVLGPRLFAA